MISSCSEIVSPISFRTPPQAGQLVSAGRRRCVSRRSSAGSGFREDFRPGDSDLLAIGFSDGGLVSGESVTDDASSRRFLAVFSRFSSSDSRFLPVGSDFQAYDAFL